MVDIGDERVRDVDTAELREELWRRSEFDGSRPAATREELLGCVEREIKMRERVYPRWVAAGRMTQKKADEELRWMREVRAIVDRAMPPLQGGLFGGGGG